MNSSESRIKEGIKENVDKGISSEKKTEEVILLAAGGEEELTLEDILYLTDMDSEGLCLKELWLSATQECPFAGEQHWAKQVANVSLPLSPKTIFTFIFGDENFMAKLYAARKFYDVVQSSWEVDADSGEEHRKITYTATLAKGLGPPASYVTEVQTLSNMKKEDELYVANCIVTNAGIPFGDGFQVHIHYCIIGERKATDGQPPLSRFNYFAGVKYTKSIVFFIKSIIEKSSAEGMESVCKDIVSELTLESEKLYGGSNPAITTPGDAAVFRKRRVKKRPPPIPNRSLLKSGSVWFLIGVFCLMGVMNGYLLNKLLKLEKQAENMASKLTLLPERELPPTPILQPSLEELQLYEDFMVEYLKKWREPLASASQQLISVENLILELTDSLPEYKREWELFVNKKRSGMDYQEEST